MLFLPSLLEYSLESLENKIVLIKQNLSFFKKLQGSQNSSKVFFHLDFVMTEFAKDAFVMESLGLEAVLFSLQKFFQKENLVLSVHLMGNSLDLTLTTDFLQQFEPPKNWQISIFVPPNFSNFFRESFTKTSLVPNLVTGIWLDLGEWENFDFQKSLVKDFLVMTVKAGKSGQKLTSQISSLALGLAQQNLNKNFILDGGWSVNFKSDLANLQIVSYSSFWQEFEQNLTKS